jgi:hypothetical protein
MWIWILWTPLAQSLLLVLTGAAASLVGACLG